MRRAEGLEIEKPKEGTGVDCQLPPIPVTSSDHLSTNPDLSSGNTAAIVPYLQPHSQQHYWDWAIPCGHQACY